MPFRVKLESDAGHTIRCNGIGGPSEPHLFNQYGGCVGYSDADGYVVFEYPTFKQANRELRHSGACVLLRPCVDGFWTSYQPKVMAETSILADRLPDVAWWTDVLHPNGSRPSSGDGIRVGIVDTPWEYDDGLEHVARLDCRGQPSPLEVPIHGSWAHGEMVTRLVAQQSGTLLGAARRSDFMFVAVSDHGVGKVDVAEVIDAIDLLADRHEADLINLSMGSPDLDPSAVEALHDSVEDAANQGALCVVAAGNSPDHGMVVYVPARFDECVGVGAVGRRDVAPKTTYSGYLQGEATIWGNPGRGGALNMYGERERIFLSPRCAIGAGLDLVAPGVGIFAHRNGGPAHELNGTSFATPLVTGVVASILADDGQFASMERDRRRVEYARRVLLQACYGLGLEPKYQGAGLPRLL